MCYYCWYFPTKQREDFPHAVYAVCLLYVKPVDQCGCPSFFCKPITQTQASSNVTQIWRIGHPSEVLLDKQGCGESQEAGKQPLYTHVLRVTSPGACRAGACLRLGNRHSHRSHTHASGVLHICVTLQASSVSTHSMCFEVL